MKIKYVISICIFVILMSMTCISASENVNQTDSLGLSIEDNFETAENNQKIIRQTPDEVELKENKNQTMNSNILGISNSEESLGAPDDGTFKTLQEKINNTDEGDTLVLENDYKNTDNIKNGILISKSLTIDGNGYTIDALSKGRIFTVTASNVILKNINFVNGYSDSDFGGAVRWDGDNGNLTGSNFTGNTAVLGGAVYWQGSNGNLTGSNFTGNNANGDGSAGGAVYWTGAYGSLSGCNFTDCSAVESSDFEESYSYGGAVYWNGTDGSLSGCNFTDCSAVANSSSDIGYSYSYSCGGAVYWNGTDGSLSGCNFTDCSAVANSSSSTSYSFSYSDSYSGGGAVYWNGADGSLSGCNFTDCSAVANSSSSSSTSYSYSYSCGGAVYWNGADGSLSGCNFTDCSAVANSSSSTSYTNSCGGAVYWNGADGSLSGCNFTDCSAVANSSSSTSYSYIWGGAVYWTGNAGSLSGSSFINNSAYWGGAVYWNGANSNINATFINNIAKDMGGAIYVNKFSDSTVTGTYTNNTATASGGANYFSGGVSGSNVTGTYTNNTAKQNGGANYFNGAVENTIIDGAYENNKANSQKYNDDGGGANYFNGTVEYAIIDGTYTNNTATSWGGANFFNKDVSGSKIGGKYTINTAVVGGANFFNNNVSGSTVAGTYANNKATSGEGGANFFRKEVSGSTVAGTYTNNKAEGYGGANCFSSVSDSNVTGTYTNNTAKGVGGANFFSSVSDSNVTGTYTNNKVEGYGGANFFYSVSDSNVAGTYTNNTAKGDGGANFFSSVSDSNVTGTYTNNNATSGGANSFWRSVSGSTVTGTYINNTANIGTIFFYNDEYHPLSFDVEIKNAIFLNNKCEYEIYTPIFQKGDIRVNDCWFGNNASNFNEAPKTINVTMGNWLFLNATADYTSLLVMDSTNITFKLNSTNGTHVFAFDNSKLPVVNLTLTASNGDVDKTTQLDKTVKYKATSKGTGTVTAKIENAQYTIYLDNNLRNVDLSVSAENITYLENEILTLTYNNTATGKVNITLNSTKYNKKIEADINHTITIADLPAGEYNVTVEYSGDNVFSNATAYANFIVEKMPTEVIVDNKTMDLFVDDDFKITYTLNPDYAVGNITFSSDDSSIVGVDSVSGDIQAKAEGTSLITVTFEGSENYTASSTNITVTVSKIPTEINITNETVELKALQSIGGLATLNPAGAGNLTYTSNDENIVGVSDDGFIYARIKGTAIVTVSFAGDDKYKAAESKNITVTVTLNDARVSVENDTLDLFVDDTYIINATSNPSFLTVYYTSSDESVATVTDYGNVKAVGEGTAIITLTVGNNETYAINYTDVKVTVSKVPTEITVNPTSLDLFVGDETVIIANLTPQDAGNVTFTSGDESIVDVDGEGNVIAQGKGTAIITVSFAGDNKYAAAENKTIKVTVSLNDARVTVDNNTLDLKVDETYAINATIEPDTIMLHIKYTSSNESVATVDKNGIVTAVGEGTAIITLEVGDNEIYAKNSTTVTVNVKDNTVNVSASDLTKYYNGPESFVVIVTDSRNNPLANQSVIINVAGVNYTRTTDANGTASIAISLISGQYDVTTIVGNNTVYSTVTVLPTVNATDLVKVFRNATQFYSTFKDSKGNYLADGTMVRFNINGVMYDRKVSGNNGLAKLNINLEQGQYVITSMNLETGENAANNVTVISRLIETKDITKYYRNGTQYTVKVIGDDGNVVGAGEIVTFNVNGVLYNRTTDESGIAKLNINLHPGDYIITAEYKDCRVSNNIKVLPVLTADDLTKKYGTPDQFIATLVDGQGNPFAGETVQFNVNGIFYNRVTDSNGQSKLNIRLMPGKYVITSSYNGTNIANTVTISS